MVAKVQKEIIKGLIDHCRQGNYINLPNVITKWVTDGSILQISKAGAADFCQLLLGILQIIQENVRLAR